MTLDFDALDGLLVDEELVLPPMVVEQSVAAPDVGPDPQLHLAAEPVPDPIVPATPVIAATPTPPAPPAVVAAPVITAAPTPPTPPTPAPPAVVAPPPVQRRSLVPVFAAVGLLVAVCILAVFGLGAASWLGLSQLSQGSATVSESSPKHEAPAEPADGDAVAVVAALPDGDAPAEREPSAVPEKPAPREAPAQPTSESVQPGQILALSFGKDDYTGDVTSSADWRTLLKSIEACPGNIVLTGHTCSLGDAETNRLIGLARAEGARDHLVAGGIALARVSIKTAGSDKPIAPNSSEDQRRLNRRVTVTCARGTTP